MMQRKNAVERRLKLLHDQWTEFAQLPEARLLRWVVEPDEMRMVEAFVHKEGDERLGECPDLFLRMEEPFDEPERYGYALREALVRLEEESRAGLEEEGLGGWRCPPVKEGGTDVEAFLAACDSLRSHYESLCEHLAVVLMPVRGVDASAWLKWLGGAVDKAVSAHVRLVVLDDARTLVLEPLAEAQPERVVTILAKLDMGRALEELSQEAGHLDTPGGKFREFFVRMGNAATKGDVEKVERLGAQAVAVAAGQGLYSLVVAAHFVMGGALLGAGRPREALEHYRQAEAAAGESETKGEPQGAQLRLKSRMAQGAAWVTAQEYAQAAKLYEETAPLARELKDASMELECWRMASWCCEVAKEVERAWEHGQRAWEVGRAMDAGTRETSTLPYVGEALVRLSHERQGAGAAREMESEVESVLGNDWRPEAPAAGGQAA
jgi:tetratricopeptide (TPR) repeat protein